MSQITTRVLDCGLPLIVEPIAAVRSAAITWLTPAGSAQDPADKQGLSTMLNELLQRGAAELDSRGMADALDRLGVTRSTNVGTLHLRLNASMLGDRLADALPLIVDMVRKPRLEEAAIEPVRDLCLQGLDSLADDPQERAVLTARARHNHPPLNRSGLGTRDGLGAISRDDLVEGWAERARPVGSILAVAGAVDPDSVARRLNELLAGWGGEAPGVETETSTTRGSYHHVDDKSAQVQIVLMHDAPPEKHPDSAPERVVNTVLSGGMASRLFTEVREKRGLCYAVSASYATERDYARVMAYVGTTPDRAQQSLDVLLAELERINSARDAGGGIHESEFQRAIVGIKSDLVFSGESTGARASALAYDYHRLGRARSLAEIAAEYDAVTLDRVNEYLARRSMGDRTTVTLGPAALNPPA